VSNTTPKYDAWVGIVAQEGGKVVVGGKRGYDVLLARYDAQGVLDPSFGVNGELNLSPLGASFLNSLIKQPDGSLLAVGESEAGGLSGFLSKISADGQVESGFGNGGKLLSNVSDVFWADAVVLPDSSIVVCGPSYVGVQDATMSKFTAQGKPDLSFGTGGSLSFAEQIYPNAIQKQADGKLLLAGFDKVMRLLPDGSPDPSFGNSGIVTLDAEGTPDYSDVQVQRDGKIIISGLIPTTVTDAAQRLAIIARLHSDGSPDPSWGENGVLLLRGLQAYRCTFDDTGNILAVGSINNGERADIVVYRILRGAYVGTVDRPSAAGQWVNVFPNPVSDLVTLQYELLQAQPVSISLYDATGRRLHSLLDGAIRAAGLHEERLALPFGLPPALYTLIIQTPAGHTAVQVVVD
ncbi:MAG TPA: hypothetical protein PKD78_15095, partial [Saprospiraceae bacterium]|nr:hypothetical protein [Saprospiraceae bacterium]